MKRLLRVVERSEWCLSNVLQVRASRLLDVPHPNDLLDEIISQSEEASQKGLISLCWQPAEECPGYFRLVAQVPLAEKTFDQFFNGRSGYRAQYYLSPEEGILYNRDVLAALEPALLAASKYRVVGVSFQLLRMSLRAPHAKIWVFQEKPAFDNAAENALIPPRWVENRSRSNRGCRAPLPKHHMIDIRGAFIHPDSGELFVDELKLDRACQLFNRGYT